MATRIQWQNFETPSGNVGYAVFAPEVPGCVVRHGNLDHAVRLVKEALISWDAEKAPPAIDFVYRYV